MLMNCEQYYDLKQEIVNKIYVLIDNSVFCFLEQGDLNVSSCPNETTFIKIKGKFDIAQAREEDGGYFDSLLAYAQDNFNQRIDFGLTSVNNEYILEINDYEADRPKNFQKMVSEMASKCMNEFLEYNQVKIVVGSDNVDPDDIQAILEDRRKNYTQQFTQNISASTQEDNQSYSSLITGSNESKLTLDLNNDSSFQDLVKRVEKLEKLVNNMTSLLKDWPSFL